MPSLLLKLLGLVGGIAALASVPGAINPNVTQANIASTICVSGWTGTVRPTPSYTSKLKRKQMVALRLPGSPLLYEEDHLIPLELGGHPTDPGNLWPQRWTGAWNAHDKDRLENRLHRMVCTRKITLTDAQIAIRTDWVAAYKRYIP